MESGFFWLASLSFYFPRVKRSSLASNSLYIFTFIVEKNCFWLLHLDRRYSPEEWSVGANFFFPCSFMYAITCGTKWAGKCTPLYVCDRWSRTTWRWLSIYVYPTSRQTTHLPLRGRCALSRTSPPVCSPVKECKRSYVYDRWSRTTWSCLSIHFYSISRYVTP